MSKRFMLMPIRVLRLFDGVTPHTQSVTPCLLLVDAATGVVEEHSLRPHIVPHACLWHHWVILRITPRGDPRGAGGAASVGGGHRGGGGGGVVQGGVVCIQRGDGGGIHGGGIRIIRQSSWIINCWVVWVNMVTIFAVWINIFHIINCCTYTM